MCAYYQLPRGEINFERMITYFRNDFESFVRKGYIDFRKLSCDVNAVQGSLFEFYFYLELYLSYTILFDAYRFTVVAHTAFLIFVVSESSVRYDGT